MDILSHCKIYPLSNYVRINNTARATQPLNHLIIDTIKTKSYQWSYYKGAEGTVSNTPHKVVIVLDLMNTWMSRDSPGLIIIHDDLLIEFKQLLKFLNNEIYELESFIKFLKLNGYDSLDGIIISEIIIDNLSIFYYDSDYQINFNQLYHILNRISQRYGCSIKTISSPQIPPHFHNNMRENNKV